MREAVYSLAVVMIVSSSPYGCHKPTPQEQYAGGRHCFAALDANLKTVPPALFRKRGFDPGAVELVATESMNGAYDMGAQLGMSPPAIGRDLEQARATYVKSHSWRPAGGRVPKFIAFGPDMTDCLADFVWPAVWALVKCSEPSVARMNKRTSCSSMSSVISIFV